MPFTAGVIAIVVVGSSIFMLRSNDNAAAPRENKVSPSTRAPTAFDLPADRFMPPLDNDRCLHLVAGIGTFQRGRSTSGQPFPASHNDFVGEWHDLAPRGTDNALKPGLNKTASAPKQVIWPTSPIEPSPKANRAALEFKSAQSAPLTMEGSFNNVASSFPFGSESTTGPRGATIAVVFQQSRDTTPGTLIELQGQGGTGLVLKLTAAHGVLAQATGVSSQTLVESKGIHVSQPTIAVVTWEASTGKLHLLALNPPPAPKTGPTVFQGTSSSAASPPTSPLTKLLIGQGSSPNDSPFRGLLSELVIYASALPADLRRLLGSNHLKSYYFKM